MAQVLVSHVSVEFERRSTLLEKLSVRVGAYVSTTDGVDPELELAHMLATVRLDSQMPHHSRTQTVPCQTCENAIV